MGSVSVRRGSLIEDWDPFEDTRVGRARRSISASARRRSDSEQHLEQERVARNDHASSSNLVLPPPPEIIGNEALPPQVSETDASASSRSSTASFQSSKLVQGEEDEGDSVLFSGSELSQSSLTRSNDSGDNSSSDSDMERNRKRESISIMAGSLESFQMARRFTGSSEGSRGSNKRLQGVEE